jgi:CDP-glucose 4,6-dehydratase
MESVAMNPQFWRDRRVFLTGHTGFKGRWLTRWLTILGAEVRGYALPDNDVRDLPALRDAMHAAQPEVVIHLAAQALVRTSYADPVTTFTTNVIGTVNVLESLRSTPSVRAAVLVTSDKCYANSGERRAFRESDLLGGSDPYSSSKACAEMAITAYRDSFFSEEGSPRIVSVRAGNVIGGGDWSSDRLVPDLVRSFRERKEACIRHPEATRPWQFVLDALHGYLLAAECAFERADLPRAFNFGPAEHEARTVSWLAAAMAARWGEGASSRVAQGPHPYEAQTLALDSSLARQVLQWKPLLDIPTAVIWTTDWYRSERDLTNSQIEDFMERATK